MKRETSKSDPGDLAAALQELRRLAHELGAETESLEDEDLREQRLYEQSLRREEWLLRQEAIPLLLGFDPQRWASLIRHEALAVAEPGVAIGVQTHLAEQALARHVNRAQDQWGIAPTDLYHWAKGIGLELPESFESLMQFILRVVKPVQLDHANPSHPDRAAVLPHSRSSDRERVLGAALNILAKCPDRCRDEHGLVSGEAIAKLIAAQSMLWFDTAEPPLGPSETAVLIDRWLE